MRGCGLLLAMLFVAAGQWLWPSSGGAADQAVSVRTVQADFVQEKHLKMLNTPLVSEGRFVFQAPDDLRWEYRKPYRSILLMHAGAVRKFSERNGRLVEEEGMRLDAMRVVLAEISDWLTGRFSDNAAFTVEFKDTRTVVLTPREDGMRAFLSRIELRLAEQAGLLDSVTLFEGPGAFTLLLFRNRLLNQPVAPALFTEP